ncbi:flagella synthesis protein FlgN [Variovorax paradoxus]|uniref:flagella synthesis protein FlgN n=1 Tax=Variovorax paradoxus TaxID=34073 RepID=UPI0027870524|nr:flagellar protein FlgN [Variovorax paradoxus]MDQ0589455.1 flagella synthesis protein FlgN [Variovorax paradoxus]
MLVHLLAEKTCVEEFLSVLEQEAQAMKNGLFADLPSLTGRKAGLLDRMAALDQARESAQVARGFEPGRAGANAAAAADGEASLAAWTALVELAQQAKACNRRNGSMVYSQLDFTQNALHYLQASAQPFYGPDGIRKAASAAGTRLAVGY